MGQCSSHRPIHQTVYGKSRSLFFSLSSFLAPEIKSCCFPFNLSRSDILSLPGFASFGCYCACRRSCYNFVSQKSPLHISTRRSPSISSNPLRYRTAMLLTSIQATLAGIGIRTLQESRGLFYSPFSYVVFFNSVQFSWINPSEHTRIWQRVSMLSASGRPRVFSWCDEFPLE